MPGWQEYLDIALKDPGVKAAGIFGQDGSTWAASANLQVENAEVHDLVAGLTDYSKFQAGGIVLAGTKYMFLSDLVGRPGLKGVAGRKGSTSVHVYLTQKAVVAVTTDGNGADLRGPDALLERLMALGF